MSAPGTFSGYQKFVVAVLAFLQFTIVLDFMMLSPLGALVMPALHIGPSRFGLVVSVYAFSAGASGFLTAGFADRFDRKKLLMVLYCGFVLGTLLCGLAWTYPMLLAARMITGLFAGVVGSVSFAIVTDLFPLQMRGRVMGVIQTSFAASSVLGIPFALFLSNRWSWNAPFFMIAAACALIGVVIHAGLRPVIAHLQQHPDRSPLHHLLHTLAQPRYLQGFATTGLLSVGGFMLMPFMSAFNVHNNGIPLTRLPLLYFVTGLFSAVCGPLIGRASDSLGKFRVFAAGSAITIVMAVIYTHLGVTPLWALIVISMILNVGIFSRMIASSALISAVPASADRGSYMSISSSLQQFAGGFASAIAGLVVVQTKAGPLLHFDVLGYVLVVTTLITLTMMYLINRRIEGTGASQSPVVPQTQAGIAVSDSSPRA
jgi:predicted MFS family arabinose efflux permease